MQHATTPTDAGAAMKTRLRIDLRAAMKNGQPLETKVIRALIAALDNAEAPPASAALSGETEIERLLLGLADVQALLLAETHEREQAAMDLECVGQADHAAALRAEAAIVQRYLT